MLKSTRWICWRCALHWTTQIATASASAALGPKSAAPASAPTALTEIEPSSSSSASASPTLTSAITASSPIMSVDEPKIAPTTAGCDAERADEADEHAEPQSRAGGTAGRWSCGAVCRRSCSGSASGTRASGSRWSPSSGTATSRCVRSAGISNGSELAPRTRLRPCSFAR